MDAMPSLEQILLEGREVEDVVFIDEDITDFAASDATFIRCHFKECTFDGARFSNCRFTQCRFSNCSFLETSFHTTHFTDRTNQKGSEWALCNLSEARFTDCDLSMSVFSKSECYLMEATNCSAMGLKFDAQVHRRVSNRLAMGGVKFEACKLQYAQFVKGNFEDSKFLSCDLRDSSFSGSDLSRCQLRGSSLHNIDLSGATLNNADISYATFDQLFLSDIFSHVDLIVSRDQHETILKSIGIWTFD